MNPTRSGCWKHEQSLSCRDLHGNQAVVGIAGCGYVAELAQHATNRAALQVRRGVIPAEVVRLGAPAVARGVPLSAALRYVAACSGLRTPGMQTQPRVSKWYRISSVIAAIGRPSALCVGSEP